MEAEVTNLTTQIIGATAAGSVSVGGVMMFFVKRMLKTSDDEKVLLHEQIENIDLKATASKESLIRLEEKMKVITDYVNKIADIDKQVVDHESRIKTAEKELAEARRKIHRHAEIMQDYENRLYRLEK